MMRDYPFTCFGLYDSPRVYAYPGYGYYGYEPGYGMGQYFGHPFMGMSPNQIPQYGMPIEKVPVVHEESYALPLSSGKAATKTKQPQSQDEVKPCQSPRPRKHPSPKHHTKHSSVPIATKQVPLKDVSSSEFNEEQPFFTPRSSAEMYEDVPFGRGFPVQQKFPADRSFVNVPVQKSSPKNTTVQAEPNAAHTTSTKTTSQTSTSEAESKAVDGQQHSHRMQEVPIVIEGSRENARPKEAVPKATRPEPAKRQLTPMEQLTNIQKEMEVIESRVENFNGEKKDKEYIILDETLTSLLLKLDMIESNGVEEIRNMRRKLVQLVQEYVQKLEHKVGIVSIEEGTIKSEAEIMEVGDTGAESRVELAEAEMHLQEGNSEPCEQLDSLFTTEASDHQDDLAQRPETLPHVSEKSVLSPLQMNVDKADTFCNDLRTDKNSDEPQLNHS